MVAGVAGALPLRDNAVDGAVLLLALPRMSELDAVFAELRRVLRPAGTLVVVVPSASLRSLAELRTAATLAPVHRSGWTNRSALDQAGWLLAAADFAVLGDDRGAFTLPLPDAAAAYALVADLPRAGWWPPGLPPHVRDRVAAGLARHAGRVPCSPSRCAARGPPLRGRSPQRRQGAVVAAEPTTTGVSSAGVASSSRSATMQVMLSGPPPALARSMRCATAPAGPRGGEHVPDRRSASTAVTPSEQMR